MFISNFKLTAQYVSDGNKDMDSQRKHEMLRTILIFKYNAMNYRWFNLYANQMNIYEMGCKTPENVNIEHKIYSWGTHFPFVRNNRWSRQRKFDVFMQHIIPHVLQNNFLFYCCFDVVKHQGLECIWLCILRHIETYHQYLIGQIWYTIIWHDIIRKIKHIYSI